MTAAVQTHELTKRYKSDFRVRTITALDSVSLAVERGEVFGCIGHNGAGKTTLIKILTGLIAASGGRATIMGRAVGDAAARRDVGFLPERPYFYEYLTAREALRFYGELSGMKAAEIVGHSRALFEMLDLTDAAGRLLKSYSKGMLQRFGMAQALVHDPHLVILDEPMSGLDPIGRGQIKAIIQRLKDEGKTIFFSTHILSDVEQLCDRVALLAHGKLWYAGTVDDLTARYEQGVEIFVAPTHLKTIREGFGRFQPHADAPALFVPKGEDAQAVLKALVGRGIEVQRMTPRRKSLEEIFLAEFRKEEAR
ncbi:MAG: ABC transporter ATP-binding protein [Myxococcales bacterium]|nr:MAG: ABC transporter ATP-binding protein [Myxococcales bacterium]